MRKTKRLVVADGDWRSCGLAAEIIALVAEAMGWDAVSLRVVRVTHPDAPAPTSKALESAFYFTAAFVSREARRLLGV